jgi:integrase
VPLSSRAREILEAVGKNFRLTTAQLDALFRKARDRAGLVDLHFHDSRRTALTRLSKRLDALELARVSGHRDLRILLQVYYAPSVEDLAAKLGGER